MKHEQLLQQTNHSLSPEDLLELDIIQTKLGKIQAIVQKY